MAYYPASCPSALGYRSARYIMRLALQYAACARGQIPPRAIRGRPPIPPAASAPGRGRCRRPARHTRRRRRPGSARSARRCRRTGAPPPPPCRPAWACRSGRRRAPRPGRPAAQRRRRESSRTPSASRRAPASRRCRTFVRAAMLTSPRRYRLARRRGPARRWRGHRGVPTAAATAHAAARPPSSEPDRLTRYVQLQNQLLLSMNRCPAPPAALHFPSQCPPQHAPHGCDGHSC